jgi:hypothetical protein
MVVNLGVLLLRGELRITVYFLYIWLLSVNLQAEIYHRGTFHAYIQSPTISAPRLTF